jgi:hypothetical protein
MNRIEVLEGVKRARTLALESNTKLAYARDAFGKSVDAVNPKAVCWCSVGALEKELDIMCQDLSQLCPVLGCEVRDTLVSANDSLGNLEEAWDMVIAKVQEWAEEAPGEECKLPSYVVSYSKYMNYDCNEDSKGYGSLKYD